MNAPAPAELPDSRYRKIFEYSAISLWEEDITRLRAWLAGLRRQPGFRLRDHLARRPDLLQEAVKLIDVTDVNAASLRLFEAENKSQLLGPLSVVLDAVSRRALAETIVAIDEGRSDVEAESSALTLKGNRLEILVRTRIPPAGADYDRMLVTIVDITERSRAEAELAWERSLFDALMGNLPDLVYFKDPSGRFLRISASTARALGLGSPSEGIGKTDWDFFTEEYAIRAHEEEQRVMRTGIPLHDVEDEQSYTDRPNTWALTSIMPLMGPQGAVAGTFGISHDITRRKELELSSRRFAALVEFSDDAIVGMDLDRRITVWNRGAERVYGYTAAEMIGTR
ncbi:MAG TPA: PAS domain-containing protein, partial [Spirochaetia bacterium]|nr:PAS domain-containing protein [Spirochaetia bacterium]